MHFTDNKDRQWDVCIDAFTVMQIREECDPLFLLNDGKDQNTYTRLREDAVLLCRVIYIICKNQIAARELDERSFYAEVIGTAIDRAMEAVLEAIINFTPTHQRDLLKAASAIASVNDLASKKAISLMKEKIESTEFSTEMDRELRGIVEAQWSEAVTPQESASVTPGSSE